VRSAHIVVLFSTIPVMGTKAIAIMIRYKDADGRWKRSVAARGDNGRIKPTLPSMIRCTAMATGSSCGRAAEILDFP
jgi:hypothetical protein